MIARFVNWLFSRRVILSEKYMVRWHLIPENRWRNFFLHKISGSDFGRDLHDHPWDFTVILLRGSYVEVVPHENGIQGWHRSRLHRAFSVRHEKAEHTHRVVKHLPFPKAIWTLVITGRRRRVWGFHTKTGWIPHESYLDLKRHGKI